MEKSYWNGNGTFQDTYKKLYDALVPGVGSCATVEGELLRASCKLYYDYYNNGMCNNTSGAARFIQAKLAMPENVNSALSDIYNECNGGGYTNKNLENQLELLADYIIQNIASKNGEYQANSEDMWSYNEPDNDDDDEPYAYGCDEDDDDDWD